MDKNTEAFIQEIEKRRGGPMGFRTYATWFGASTGEIRDYGVFLYKIGDVFFFEDFERQPTIFGIKIPEGKNKKPYEKLEGSFRASDIVSSRLVVKKRADFIITAKGDLNRLQDPNFLQKFFSELVTEITLADGRKYYMQLLDPKMKLEEQK